jgi:hypothetical protein
VIVDPGAIASRLFSGSPSTAAPRGDGCNFVAPGWNRSGSLGSTQERSVALGQQT